MNRREAKTQRFLKEVEEKIKRGFLHFSYFSFYLSAALCLCGSILLFSLESFAQNKYENRKITQVSIAFEGRDTDASAADQFRLIAVGALGDKYSAVKVREALDALYKSKKIVTAQVEATPVGENNVNLRFVIKRKTQAESVKIKIGNTVGDPVTEEELLLKLNLINSGASITKQILDNNTDLIQSYLREKGFYNAEVTYKQDALTSENRVAVTFQVIPKIQSRLEDFSIKIKGFDESKIRKTLKLKKFETYSREKLISDVEKIRKAILKESFLAPRLEEPKVIFDNDTNSITVELKGEVGAKVDVKVEVEKEKIGKQTQERLLPIKRDGTLDYSAIEEGKRRLENYYQQKGFFFAEAEPRCSVTPDFPKDAANPVENDSRQLCEVLGGADLENRTVKVNYSVELNRRLNLKDIRIEGTKLITIPDIISVLDTQRASLVGYVPRLGYGRGYTSNELLESDRQRIESIMKELGYRRAKVRVKQGVSPDGTTLIITFVVTEGIPTKVEEVDIVGNKVFLDSDLRKELPELKNRNYSRARARNGAQKIAQLYAREGYFDAHINFSIIDLPQPPDAKEDKIKIVYTIEKEGKKVFINRILVNGNERTDLKSVMTAITLKPDQVLRNADIFTSEQNLYASDAFRSVTVKQEPAGETPSGDARRDIIINLEEQKPRILSYGGGYSTELGWQGFFDIRHVNLFGKLQQGGARVRWSNRQQLIQFDYLNPRFIRDGKEGFAPLSITAQYQRDSTVTRFFRSAFDTGTFGIVQRLDENGKPVDVFGAQTGDPTLNRFSLIAETSRTVSKKDRSLLFLRYRYEDVRLYNIDSLLIAELLRPDRIVRTSGFGVTFVRDTRENCSRKTSLLELISKGEPGNPCRYNPSDATRGSYLTAEYNVSARELGANISFQKFSLNYQTYYQIPKANNTILAGRAVLGLGNVLSKSTRFTGNLQGLNGSLPISERFFAGGSTTLRGFEFESAGPRVAVVPQGTFRDSNGKIVSLNPFTVPFGGNGLAIVNLEARIPLSNEVQAVPFYDGGNVFNRAGDIFKPIQSSTGNTFTDNLRAEWTNTIGLGFRIKTPFGGSFAVDYGYLLSPPTFLIPQKNAPDAILRLKQGQLHFRFAQTF